MSRPRFSVAGNPGTMNGAGLGQSIGWWRPEKSTGKIAIPEGPQAPRDLPETDHRASFDKGEVWARERTAENRAAHDQALAPRRWRPS